MGKMATVGLVPTVFGSLMNVTGAALATWWRDRPPRDEGVVPEPVLDAAVHSKKGAPSGA
jgi:BASS family bile acid:Na+ symporter